MAKRLFVGGLPYTITEAELRELFAKIGEVSTCDLIIDRFTGKSKGFAFVEMKNDADTDEAIKQLNEKEIENRKIVVNVARPREERSDRNFNSDNRRSFDRNGGNRFNRKSY